MVKDTLADNKNNNKGHLSWMPVIMQRLGEESQSRDQEIDLGFCFPKPINKVLIIIIYHERNHHCHHQNAFPPPEVCPSLPQRPPPPWWWTWDDGDGDGDGDEHEIVIVVSHLLIDCARISPSCKFLSTLRSPFPISSGFTNCSPEFIISADVLFKNISPGIAGYFLKSKRPKFSYDVSKSPQDSLLWRWSISVHDLRPRECLLEKTSKLRFSSLTHFPSLDHLCCHPVLSPQDHRLRTSIHAILFSSACVTNNPVLDAPWCSVYRGWLARGWRWWHRVPVEGSGGSGSGWQWWQLSVLEKVDFSRWPQLHDLGSTRGQSCKDLNASARQSE